MSEDKQNGPIIKIVVTILSTFLVTSFGFWVATIQRMEERPTKEEMAAYVEGYVKNASPYALDQKFLMESIQDLKTVVTVQVKSVDELKIQITRVLTKLEVLDLKLPREEK